MSTKGAEPSLNMYQVVAAGLAATVAAFVTSRFGVAGTLIGAGLTAMIITGGSAILKAYIESASTRVRGMPTRIRSWGGQRQAASPEEPKIVPGRPDLKNNFVGRMRAALDWFSNLPATQRRSIIIKGLVAAVVAFVICMAAIWAVEKVINNSLSCGFWGNCPAGAEPGFHPAGYGGTGAESSLSGGDVGTLGGGGLTPTGAFDGGQDIPVFGGNDGGGQDTPVFGGNDGAGQHAGGESASPEPDAGSSASPAPEEPEEPDPASASPAAQPEEAPESASPAAEQ